MLLNESFSYKIGNIETKNGYNLRVAYIDTKSSQDTYNIRNKIQSFGAKWFPIKKWWYWNLGNNPENVIRTQVQPCIEELSKIEDMGGDPRRDVIATVEKLIAKVNGSTMPKTQIGDSKEEILSKLNDFKSDLVRITSDKEFKSLMEPIIKFRNANGYQYSLLNTILILVQDPEAIMVKTKTDWSKLNRTIKKGAKAISLRHPVGKRNYTPEEQKLIEKDFLKKKKVKTIEELTPGDKEKLRKLKNSVTAVSFDLGPYWYDYRFTEQMTDKEDLVGNPGYDIEWFDESGDETNDSISKINALLQVIENQGIELNYVDDLGGARGVSKSGVISILKNTPKNIGMLNTIVHEFAHELLHQSYLKSKNEDMKEYFVGKQEGRAKVEQQAELCAWIVLRSFGYDMQTNINYVGIWGLNQDNAVKVFDSVSNVAAFISTEIIKQENENKYTMAESKKYIKENNIPSGYEIAKMVGCGDIYRKVALKNKKKTINVTESELHKIIKESVIKILKNI